MEKSQIYEHLARIYLDASLKYKKKKKNNLWILSLGLVTIAVLVFSFSPYLLTKIKLPAKNTSFVLTYEPVKINFNFGSIKKEILTFDLNNMNLKNFKFLSFRVRKSNFLDNIHLRIEFLNNFGEIGSFYLSNISNRWNEFKISLSDFKNISDWSNVKKLNFILEEWNTNNKVGKIYFDDIKILK